MRLQRALLPLVLTFASVMSTGAQQPAPASAGGVWLGTLAAGAQTLRLQLHLQPDTTGPGACVLDSIDQKAFGIPCTVAVDGAHITVKVPSVAGGWDGNLSADGKTLTGTWSQGTGLPLSFTRQATAIPPSTGAASGVDPAKAPVPVRELKGVLDSDLAATVASGAFAPATHAGITVGVVQGGHREIFTYGIAKPDSLFEIGSITKTFTGLILAQMTQQGLVHLDEPVRALLPAGTVQKPATGAEITLLDLSDQHSGLPRMPSNFAPANPANPYADYNRKLLYAFIATQGVALPPNAPFGYSNLGVGLLGQALADRAGVAYPELVHGQITGPLGMHDTAIALTPALQARLLQGYDSDRQPAHVWDLDALAGAGAIRSTAADMLTYLEAQLHPDRLPASATATPAGKTLPAALAQSHVVHAEVSPGMHIALNWFHYDDSGSFWHNGGTGGYSTYALFNPAEDFGIIVLTNSGPGPHSLADSLGMHIAQRLEGKPAIALHPLS